MVEANKSAIFSLSLAFIFVLLLSFTSATCTSPYTCEGCSCTSTCEECNNGIIEGTEQCDDGGLNGVKCIAGYGSSCTYCTTSCKILTVNNFCGDWYRQDVEECDDGNNWNGDGCSSTCKVEITPICGNSIIEGTEQCDKGTLNGLLCWAGYGSSCTYCTTSCKIKSITNYCGDGIKQECEGCDDGNTANGDGCSSTCKVEITPPPSCGDGTCNGAETCSTCSIDCGICPTPDPVCGNGIIQSGEQCDDGNIMNGDGCSSICKTEEKEYEDNDTEIKKNHFVQFCSTNWECSGWSECSNGIMTRECIDTNHCGLIYDMPYEQTGCNELSNALVEVNNAHNFWLILLIILLVILLIILVNLL